MTCLLYEGHLISNLTTSFDDSNYKVRIRLRYLSAISHVFLMGDAQAHHNLYKCHVDLKVSQFVDLCGKLL